MLLLLAIACADDDVWIDVAAGSDITCAVSARGRVACWGIQFPASMTDGGEVIEIRDVPDDPLVSVDVSPSAITPCGLSRAGVLVCWGSGSTGILSVPDETFVDFALDRHGACGLREDGSITCWGEILAGEILAALDLVGPEPFVDVGLSWSVCGIDATGRPTCIPETAEPGGSDHVEIDTAPNVSCFREGDGDIECPLWPSPPGLPPAAQLSTASSFVCVRTAEGEVVCRSFDPADPVPQLPAGPWAKVTSGEGHVCGLRPDGSILCVGDDDFGQVSDVDALPLRGLRER